MNEQYGLWAINQQSRNEVFYVYKGDPSMKNWVALVVFKGTGYTVYPFKSNSDLAEKIGICGACAEKLHELSSKR